LIIRHELVPTSRQNSESTGHLFCCDHHIDAATGIELGSGGKGYESDHSGELPP